jgi:hypothetical protein
MSIIEASSVGVRTMADGTLRLVVDIEPRHARDAFSLFGSPGTSMALTALKVGAKEVEAVRALPPTHKGGELSKLAGKWCRDELFIKFLREKCAQDYRWEVNLDTVDDTEQYSRFCITALCGISSRAELDHDHEAAEKFHELVRKPYMAWLKEKSWLG